MHHTDKSKDLLQYAWPVWLWVLWKRAVCLANSHFRGVWFWGCLMVFPLWRLGGKHPKCRLPISYHNWEEKYLNPPIFPKHLPPISFFFKWEQKLTLKKSFENFKGDKTSNKFTVYHIHDKGRGDLAGINLQMYFSSFKLRHQLKKNAVSF